MYIYTGYKRKRKKSYAIPAASVVVLITVLFIVFSKNASAPVETDSIHTQSVDTVVQKISDTPIPKESASLKQTILTRIGNELVNYSVFVKDLRSDFSMGINESVVFDAASVNKIPIIASLYHRAQEEPHILEKQITVQADDIQNYGTGIIQYEPPGTAYTVQTLARLMMQKSDNTAAYILSRYIVGPDIIQNDVNSWGLTQTDIEENKTSNVDMYLLMEKIFSGEVTDDAHTKEMLSFLKDSDFEDRIPSKLPPGVQVYHKIGNADGGFHDVGIVETPSGQAYYIGMLTSDIKNPEQTISLMADVSQIVYDFMTR